jgi:HEAT repeat protein
MGIRWTATLPAALVRARNTGAFASRNARDENAVTAIIKRHPPLLERLCLESGRATEKKAIETLLSVLAWKPREARAEAAIALGAFKEARVVKALQGALVDGDAWVRACAARSLARLSGQEIACDWLFGSATERAKGSAAWREWFDNHPVDP